MNASERRAAYLDDLGRLLAPLTPVERVDAVDGVRDRIAAAVAALGHPPSDEEMAAILEQIGPVEAVARREIVERSTPTGAQPTTAAATSPPAAATPSAATTPAESAATPAAAEPEPRRRYDLSSVPKLDWPDEQAPRPAMTKRWLPPVIVGLILLGAFFLTFLLPALVLIIGIILLWISPLWSTGEKAIGTAVPAIGLGAFLPLVALGLGRDGNPVLLVIALTLGLAGIVALVWVARRGFRAARELDREYA